MNQKRAKPGARGEGDFYHIGVRDKNQFEKFRTQDVGDEGHLERLAGQRENGNWDTVKWMVSKNDAKVDGSELVATTKDAQELFDRFDSAPRHIEGDRFAADPKY